MTCDDNPFTPGPEHKGHPVPVITAELQAAADRMRQAIERKLADWRCDECNSTKVHDIKACDELVECDDCGAYTDWRDAAANGRRVASEMGVR